MGRVGESTLKMRVSRAYREMRQKVPPDLRQALLHEYQGGEWEYAKKQSKKHPQNLCRSSKNHIHEWPRFDPSNEGRGRFPTFPCSTWHIAENACLGRGLPDCFGKGNTIYQPRSR